MSFFFVRRLFGRRKANGPSHTLNARMLGTPLLEIQCRANPQLSMCDSLSLTDWASSREDAARSFRGKSKRAPIGQEVIGKPECSRVIRRAIGRKDDVVWTGVLDRWEGAG